MDRDENNYWHMRTPYDTTALSKICTVQEPISVGNLFQLYTNAFLGANIAEASQFSLDATRTLKADLSAVILRSCMFHSVRIMLYDILRRSFFYIDAENREMISIPAALLCASSAGCIAQAIYNPINMLKLNMQQRKESGFMEVLKSIRGKSAIWKTAASRCTHACLLTAGDVAAYDLSKRNLKKYLQLKEQIPLHLASSLTAGLVASLLSHPADVIRLRLLTQPTDEQGLIYKRSLECVVKLIREEGVTSLYKGLLPCWLRLGSWSVVFWLSVEQLRYWQGQTGF